VCARIYLHVHLPAIYANTNTNPASSVANRDSNFHCNSYCDFHSHCDTNYDYDCATYSDFNTYSDSYPHTNADRNSDVHPNRDSNIYTYFDTETFTDAATSANAPATPYFGPTPVGLSLKKMVQLNHLTNR
jgi:hypothetical protein